LPEAVFPRTEDLLSVELRIVALVEQEQFHDAGGEARTPRHRPVRVQSPTRRLERSRQPNWTRQVARMPREEVVSDTASDRIELDGLADDIAPWRDLIAVQRQHFGRTNCSCKSTVRSS
jgi:hypothetical protein